MKDEQQPGNTPVIPLPDTYSPDPAKDGNVKEVTGRLRARHLIPIYLKKLETVLQDLEAMKKELPAEAYTTYQASKAGQVYVVNCTIRELEALERIRERKSLTRKKKA